MNNDNQNNLKNNNNNHLYNSKASPLVSQEQCILNNQKFLSNWNNKLEGLINFIKSELGLNKLDVTTMEIEENFNNNNDTLQENNQSF